MAREDIYKMAHELSRDLGRAHRGAQQSAHVLPMARDRFCGVV